MSASPSAPDSGWRRDLRASEEAVRVRTGWNQYTGAGRLNADAALKADPKWQLTVRVTTVQPAQQAGRTVIEVRGTVTGSSLSSYSIQVGQGATPGSWQSVGQAARTPVDNGLLGSIPATAITSAGQWTIRVVARDATGAEREARGTLTVR
jgi:hypothetical protein